MSEDKKRRKIIKNGVYSCDYLLHILEDQEDQMEGRFTAM